MYKIDFNHPCHVHFIGIGGISMSGFAELLHSFDFTVTGSDWHESKDHRSSGKPWHTSSLWPESRKYY